jgi:hypothetical protein
MVKKKRGFQGSDAGKFDAHTAQAAPSQRPRLAPLG